MILVIKSQRKNHLSPIGKISPLENSKLLIGNLKYRIEDIIPNWVFSSVSPLMEVCYLQVKGHVYFVHWVPILHPSTALSGRRHTVASVYLTLCSVYIFFFIWPKSPNSVTETFHQKWPKVAPRPAESGTVRILRLGMVSGGSNPHRPSGWQRMWPSVTSREGSFCRCLYCVISN